MSTPPRDVTVIIILSALLHLAGGAGDRRPQASELVCMRDCSGHGRCVDGGTCLCEQGWFGGNCSREVEGWAKMHRLEHNFYEHDAFKSRYVLAAHHLRHCKHIVEIGGYRTPISLFLRSHHQSVTTIDPYIKPLAADTLNGAPCKVRHLPMMFEDYTLSGHEDCFLYIGLDYYDEENRPACGRLKDAVHRFQTVVVDYAARYPTGAACFQALELPSAFDRVASVLLEVDGNDWGDLTGSWLPTGLTTRAFYALRHRSAPPMNTLAKTFKDPSQYSGSGAAAADSAAAAQQQQQQLLPDSQEAMAKVMARAGGAVGPDTPDSHVGGWSLQGLVDAPSGKEDERVGVGGGGWGGGEGGDLAPLPTVADAWATAIQYAQQRKWKEATAYWSQHVRELSSGGQLPHVAQVFEFAMALYRGHQVKAALPLLAKVVEMEPTDARGYNNLGMALESLGEVEEARKVLEGGLEHDAGHFLRRTPYALCLMPNALCLSLGEVEEARKVLEGGLEHDAGHYSLNYNYAKMLLDLDRTGEAIEHLARAAVAAPDNPDVHFYLGSALRQQGLYAQSNEAYGMVERLSPKYVHRYINTETNEHYEDFVRDEQVLLEEGCSEEAPNLCLLRSIVSQLRKLETSLEFIGDRQMDGRKTQILTGYMKHSFAYGSTFYQSWLQVFKNAVLAEAVEHMRQTGKLYGVLGSSIGWHVFYGALTWEVRARGWEILCSQVKIAKSLADAHGLNNQTTYTGIAPSGRGVATRFECLDALQADLWGVHVLVLAFSRDVDLGAVLNRKLAAELQPGALVVSWSRILDAQPEFVRAAVYKVAVSWSDSWGMYVYRRR